MFCKYCGKEIKDDARFCVYCGKEVKSGDNAKRDDRERPEASHSRVILYVILTILVLVAAASILFFVVIRPRIEGRGQDSEMSSDHRKKVKMEEAGEEDSEENSVSEEEESGAEETEMSPEQCRASLESTWKDLEAQYGYADLSPRDNAFNFMGEYSSELDNWNVWTNLHGIAKAEICDLDGDGQEELFVILLEGKDIHLCVYEVDADQPSSAPVKSAETVETRSGDLHRHEDVCTKVDGSGAVYLLFMQAYWGGWGDGYYGQVKLYRYDGTNLYTPLTVEQEAEASAEFVYFARQYEADGGMLSEEVIYDDAASYGTYLDENYCRERMKKLFGDYGISVGDRAAVYIYDGNFDDFLAPGQKQEELMKLRMWSDSDMSGERLIFYFNGVERLTAGADGYILPGSDTRYLSRSDLAGMTKEECRFARNELYARHGRIFDDVEVQDYFNEKEWYTGSIAPEDFDEDILNDYELKNRDLIIEYEKEMGYR